VPATYEPIATTTLGTAVTTFTMSSIPSTYTDFRLVFTPSGYSGATGGIGIRYNTDTSTLYSTTYMRGTGSAADSGRTSANSIILQTPTLATTSIVFFTLDTFSYTASTNKTSLWECSTDLNGSGLVVRGVGLYRSTSAINSITIYNPSGYTFNVGTTATLYGIKNA
jgi:hypothetical protein